MIHLKTKKGAAHPLALFSPDEVKAIRRRFEQAEAGSSRCPSCRAIARELGCCHLTIWRIINYYTYNDRDY